VQEVGFPTRNEVEGGRRPVCTSAARKIGVLLARARDGVPQEAWFPCFARSAGEYLGWALRAGKARRGGCRKTVASHSRLQAGRRDFLPLGQYFIWPLMGEWLIS